MGGVSSIRGRVSDPGTAALSGSQTKAEVSPGTFTQ